MITAGHARALLTHPEPERALKAVLANGLSVRATEALAHQGPELTPRHRDPDMVKMQRELSGLLGLTVEISGTYDRGMVRVGYASRDQLEGVLTLLRG